MHGTMQRFVSVNLGTWALLQHDIIFIDDIEQLSRGRRQNAARMRIEMVG